MVPGYQGLLRMTSMLLAERTPKDGRVLVLGAGGGLELKAFGDAHSGWTFDGVDPSAEMLGLAEETAAEHMKRIRLHVGTIETAQEGPFDSATCLLMFHHQPLEQRLETLKQVRRRLKTGAPFVVALMSFPQAEPERRQWIARHVAFQQLAMQYDPSVSVQVDPQNSFDVNLAAAHSANLSAGFSKHRPAVHIYSQCSTAAFPKRTLSLPPYGIQSVSALLQCEFAVS